LINRDAVKEKYKENLIKTPFDRIKLDELTELSLSFKSILINKFYYY
jgi:hypothetical protein